MILIEEAIQRVQSLYSKGVQSKDSRLTPRHIYSCLITGRTLLLQQKANKNQYISQWNYQTLPCTELVDAPLHECPCAPTGVTMLRSKEKLPRVITSLNRALILSVSTLDGSTSFDEKQYETFGYTKGRKYTSLKPFYFIKNEFLYIGLATKIKAVMVTGLFHDPYEVYQYPKACDDCSDCSCKSPMEIEFPIDGDLLKPCVELASQEAIYLFKQMLEDHKNDASDDEDTKGSMIHKPE